MSRWDVTSEMEQRSRGRVRVSASERMAPWGNTSPGSFPGELGITLPLLI